MITQVDTHDSTILTECENRLEVYKNGITVTDTDDMEGVFLSWEDIIRLSMLVPKELLGAEQKDKRIAELEAKYKQVLRNNWREEP